MGSLIIVDNVIRKGAVIDPNSPDANVQGVRRFFDRLAAEPRDHATALQTVGVKGYDGLALGDGDSEGLRFSSLFLNHDFENRTVADAGPFAFVLIGVSSGAVKEFWTRYSPGLAKSNRRPRSISRS